MKLTKMYEECKKNKGICKNCKLNVVNDWLETQQDSWCFIQIRQNHIKAYQEYMKEKNEILAERTKIRYEELEKKYLGDNT